METYELRNVPIFSVGTWNGDTYQEADLDHMVAAFNQVGFSPPMKLGHDPSQQLAKNDGMPAVGWVANLRRAGTQLYCDIKDLPKRVYDAIKRKNYNRVSAEIYWDYTSDGKKWPRVLKALSLLGADIPAVTSLASLEQLYDAEGKLFKRYDFGSSDMPMMICPSMRADSQLMEAPKKDKATVHYRTGGGDEDQDGLPDVCGSCEFFCGPSDPKGGEMYVGTCSLVDGEVASGQVCDLYEADEAFQSFSAKDTSTHFVRPHGDQFAVVQQSDGKVLKAHPTRAEAVSHMEEIKASKASAQDRPHQYTDFTNKPWDGSASRFTIDEMMQAVPDAIRKWAVQKHKAAGNDVPKSDLKLPFREPDGVVNLNGVRAALAAIGGARGGVKGIPQEVLDSARLQLEDLLKQGNDQVKKNSSATQAQAGDHNAFDGVKGRTVDEQEKKIAELTAQLMAIGTEKADLERKYSEASTKVSELSQKLPETEQKLAALEAEKAELAEKARVTEKQAWFSSLTTEGNLKILPVERPIVEHLYDQLSGVQVKSYSEGGKEISNLDALKLLFESRKPGTFLFKEMSVGTATTTAGSPDTKQVLHSPAEAKSLATARAKQYMKDRGEKVFAIALKAVFDEDPDLKSMAAGITPQGVAKADSGQAHMRRMFRE